MTGTEVALVITACGTLITALTSAVGVIVSRNNSKKLDTNSEKIDEVHKTANSLAARNEKIAKALGVAEGIKQEKENPS